MDSCLERLTLSSYLCYGGEIKCHLLLKNAAGWKTFFPVSSPQTGLLDMFSEAHTLDPRYADLLNVVGGSMANESTHYRVSKRKAFYFGKVSLRCNEC